MTSGKRKKENKEYIKNNFLFEVGEVLRFNSSGLFNPEEASLIIVETTQNSSTMLYKVLVLRSMTILALDKKFIEGRYCRV